MPPAPNPAQLAAIGPQRRPNAPNTPSTCRNPGPFLAGTLPARLGPALDARGQPGRPLQRLQQTDALVKFLRHKKAMNPIIAIALWTWLRQRPAGTPAATHAQDVPISLADRYHVSPQESDPLGSGQLLGGPGQDLLEIQLADAGS